MEKKNGEHRDFRYCPFKKATVTENNIMTGQRESHERFEECAGARCMAYKAGTCKLMEGKENVHKKN